MDKARAKLLAEFEEWYRVCYIGGEPLDGAVCEEVDAEGAQSKKVRSVGGGWGVLYIGGSP